MSPLQRLVAVLIAVLVIAGVAVVAVGLLDQTETGGPDVSASNAPSPSPYASADSSIAPSPGATTSPPDEDEVLAILREVEEQVIAIRGLPPAEIGPPELITRAELGAELERLFEEDYPPDEQARDNAALRALGLLDPGQDVAELQLELLGEGVLGFYDDEDQRMVVVTDAGLDASARLTYAHEYTHALQDAAFGLDSLETDAEGEDDRGLARTALIEGDATVTMLAWAFANLTQAELVEVFESQQPPDTAGIPSWMVSQLQFPYNEGALWVGGLAGDPLAPGFTEVDAAFADPPDSTEQVIHPEAWDPREAPDTLDAPDLAATLGAAWTEVDETSVGEAFLRIILEHHGVDRDEAVDAGDGWGGDRVAIATGPDDAFALAWILSWDTPADADEFAAAYRSIVEELPFPATVVELDADEVLVAHASTADLLNRAVEAAGG